MPRDYKSRANPRAKRKRGQAPGWVWFIAGLLVGLLFSGLAWLKLLPPPRVALPVVPAQRPPAKPAAKPEKEPAPPKPRFDFYTILPEMEVVVPEPEEEPPRVVSSRPETPKSPAPVRDRSPSAGGGERYMLQMGSFRRYADADRLKASLALVGIRAEIQKVRIGSGETFHRVRSGPYSRDKVNRLRAKLKQNRISSLVIKLK